MNHHSGNYFGIKLSKYLVIYHCSVFILFFLTYYFAHPTYPIAGELVGNGRFSDWWGTIYAALKYPETTSIICTVPWMQMAILKPLGQSLGPYLLHIFYILLTLLVLTHVYQYLCNKIGKLNSILMIFTYPLIFAFWRGNTDLIIFGLILCGCLSYKENNIRNSLIWFGIAATFKPFALLYLLIFKVRDLADNFKIILTGTIGVVALILIGNINFFSSLDALSDCGKNYTNGYMIGEGGTLHNNSLWGLFKFIVYSSVGDLSSIKETISTFSWYTKIWPIVTVLFFLGIKNRIQVFKFDGISNSIFLLNLITVLLLPISPDYRLYLVSISLILLSINEVASEYNKSFMTICLLLILLPKHVLWLNYFDVNFTVNGPINTTLLIALLSYLLFGNLNSKHWATEKTV